jgi:hypothetical protein
LQVAVRRHGEIAAPGIADAAGGGGEQKHGVHDGGIEGCGEPREIGPHTVDPDGVGIDQEERRIAKFGQGVADAAAGAEQQAALVGDHDPRAGARFQMALHLLGEVMNIDHRPLDAGRGEAVEHVVDQRLARDRDQRLRHFFGERMHAGAHAGGEHHGVAGCLRHNGESDLRGGTLTRYQP